jgi:hypothetical protein
LGDIEGLRNVQVVETGFVFSSTADHDQSLRLDQGDVDIALEGFENAYGGIDTLITSDLLVSAPSVIRPSSDCLGAATMAVNIRGARQSPSTSICVVWSDNENIMYPLIAFKERFFSENSKITGYHLQTHDILYSIDQPHS